MRKRIIIFLILVSLASSGCTIMRYMLDKNSFVRIPQMLAHIHPTLENNSFLIEGEIEIMNANKSDLELSDIELDIMNEDDQVIISKSIKWKNNILASGEKMQAPLQLELKPEVIANDLIKIRVVTSILHKHFKIRVPIDDTIAILYLDSLQDALIQPVNVTIYTKIYPQELKNIMLDYKIDFNRFNLDLILEKLNIVLYKSNSASVTKIKLKDIFLKADTDSVVTGNINLTELLDNLRFQDIFSFEPLNILLEGRLRLPNTDIVRPLSIRAIQELDLKFLEK